MGVEHGKRTSAPFGDHLAGANAMVKKDAALADFNPLVGVGVDSGGALSQTVGAGMIASKSPWPTPRR